MYLPICFGILTYICVYFKNFFLIQLFATDEDGDPIDSAMMVLSEQCFELTEENKQKVKEKPELMVKNLFLEKEPKHSKVSLLLFFGNFR